MSSNGWKVERLEDICSLITDGKHGDCQNEENSGYFFLSAKDILNGKLNYENARQITKHDFEETNKRTQLEPCDILITNSGTIGRMAFVTNHNFTRRTTFQKSVAILKPIKEKVYPPFLYYCLAARKTDIKNTASGTTQENLLLGDIRKFSISIPESIETQRRIADILSTFDEKIELNRQTNATLEAIAQAIFKEWFVDFNYPGATGEMVDSELGPIPKGWQVVNINSLSQVIYGAPFASSLFTKDSIGRPLIRIRDLPNEQPSAFTIEVHPKGYLAKPGDILVGMDGEFRAYLWGGDDSWVNQRICAFKPVIEIPSPFLYFSIIEPLAKVEATETATTVIHLGKNDIDLFRFALPSIEVLRDFGNITEPIFEKIIINKKESRILSTTRDILLTRLMTGKVEI